ncbi:hypothetical protein TNIN_416641 [Trichonephila inaurata madagascariensis]|uniref:Uncharacterized protein n=1 Tax=Trichonephila inaurata madagascariensis TaxID=2747483 RepID=A0A8X6YMM6_9ARAC|nr:hypothetical protein TNIN_416641 [Trichonephila inaurata madagascariensis]
MAPEYHYHDTAHRMFTRLKRQLSATSVPSSVTESTNVAASFSSNVKKKGNKNHHAEVNDIANALKLYMQILALQKANPPPYLLTQKNHVHPKGFEL